MYHFGTFNIRNSLSVNFLCKKVYSYLNSAFVLRREIQVAILKIFFVLIDWNLVQIIVLEVKLN